MESLDLALDRYHEALGELVKGHHEPALRMFSQREDAVLCNPFRPFARGPSEIAETTAQAASRFANGEISFERISTVATSELACILEIERFNATLDGSEGSGSLRVTTVLRPEEDGWRVVHRHADPITTPQATRSIVQT